MSNDYDFAFEDDLRQVEAEIANDLLPYRFRLAELRQRLERVAPVMRAEMTAKLEIVERRLKGSF